MNLARLRATLLSFAVLVAVLLGITIGTGNSPALGLDLEGGLSVILAADTDGASAEDLEFVRDLVRDQLESSGIAEPDVRVEGANVIVDLPGVRDQEQALAAVAVSGIVDLRPVLAVGIGDVTDDPDAPGAVLPGLEGITYTVGPSGAQGDVFVRKSAGVDLDPQTGAWLVTVDLSSTGEGSWNVLASQCFAAASTCPTGQLAIVLDDVVQSAPRVNQPSFSGGVSITGSFTEAEARSLADVLNRGAFPVQMVQERVEAGSPTAGQDALDAALIAGLIGVLVMLAAMLAYYRRLAIVILAGLAVWGMTVYTLATFVSRQTNYALTLAGATGIIVAVGVTVDTYVVFFERLRDEMRNGRTLRNAAPQSFTATWRTILSADLVSLLASLVLFWLSVGSVKGFALYLGLTTICDLLVFYFFTRPSVFLLSTTRWFSRSGTTAGTSTIGVSA
ncbi:MAG: protein translocase subunit SecD [Ilumatobacteraceae bacterium]